jgi:hypothetical protein
MLDVPQNLISGVLSESLQALRDRMAADAQRLGLDLFPDFYVWEGYLNNAIRDAKEAEREGLALLGARSQARLIEAQQQRIDLLERLLAPPGPRAWARLRRSPWHVRLLRALVG